MIRNTNMLAKRIQALEARTTQKMEIVVHIRTAPPDSFGPAMTCTVIDKKED